MYISTMNCHLSGQCTLHSQKPGYQAFQLSIEYLKTKKFALKQAAINIIAPKTTSRAFVKLIE